MYYPGTSMTLQEQIQRVLKEAEDQVRFNAPGSSEVQSPSPAPRGSSEFVEHLGKLAAAAVYCGDNFHLIEDHQPELSNVQELDKLAHQLIEYNKIAQSGDAATKLPTSTPVHGTQKEPSKGKRIIPLSTAVDRAGQLATNAGKAPGGREDWSHSMPTQEKKANVFHRALSKLAQAPMGGPPPGGAPPMGGPPPGGPPPGGAPPGGAPPGPPPGPDPAAIAMQLAQAGQLTPENLSQAAGIPPEQAMAVISSLTGQPSAAAPPGPPPPPPGPPGGAPPPPGAPPGPPGGAPKQASHPTNVFMTALNALVSKTAEDAINPAQISGSIDKKRPEDYTSQDVGYKVPDAGQRGVVMSDSRIMNADGEQVREPRKDALRALFTSPIPSIYRHGKGDSPNVDSFLSAKTASTHEGKETKEEEHEEEEALRKKKEEERRKQNGNGNGEKKAQSSEPGMTSEGGGDTGDKESGVLMHLLENLSPMQKKKLMMMLSGKGMGGGAGMGGDSGPPDKEAMGGNFGPNFERPDSLM